MKYIRIQFKNIIKKFFLIPSYCKDCGIDIHDFVVDNTLWNEIMDQNQQTVCYNCFCKRGNKKNIYNTYKLIKI